MLPFGATWFAEIFREGANTCSSLSTPSAPADFFDIDSSVGTGNRDAYGLVSGCIAVPGQNISRGEGGGSLGRKQNHCKCG